MYRASNILQTARLDKDITVEEIAKRTKIPAKYLHAFEIEDKNNFPKEPYCSLMVKDYASVLGLNPDYVLSLFLRDFDIKNKPTKFRKEKFCFTPQLTFIISIYLGIILFISYLVFEYFQYNSPPPLKVNWSDLIIENDIVQISGETSYDSTIRINDDLIVVDNDGHFLKRIKYPPKDNKIVVEARSPSGKISKDEKFIK